METPRPWQFGLANWSVTRKVGIVLVLPVVLATAFAVLRINNELRTLDGLDAATEQAIVIRPALAYGAATQRLAVAATANWGKPTDPQTQAALDQFDAALSGVETTLRSGRVNEGVRSELSSAVGVGGTLRSGLGNGSPAVLGDQADEIAVRIGNALALSPTVTDLAIQRYFLELTTMHSGQRLLTTQHLVVSAHEDTQNPAARARVLTSGGAESTTIQQYGQIFPELSGSIRPLLDAVQTRLNYFSQYTGDPAQTQAVHDSLRSSADTYNAAINQLLELIDHSLQKDSVDARTKVLIETAIVIAMLLAGLALALSVARALVVPVRHLRRDALHVARTRLPQELEVVRKGGNTPDIEPVGIYSTEEIGQLARAIDEMHEQALELAAGQARLRVQIGNMFETLSRRSQSLVEQQLSLIEELERDEEDSDRLQSLFRLDHLATRMRRNGDNLLVLAGTSLRRGQTAPVDMGDMLFSAVSQVEDYQRVHIGGTPGGVVASGSAVDIEHLLAELIDNALRYSPPDSMVTVTIGRAVDGGYLIEITDLGLGMTDTDLAAANAHLASGGEVTVETARRMGLFVVGRLAARHGITVNLRRTTTTGPITQVTHGITASVHLPGTLVARDERSPRSAARSQTPAGQSPGSTRPRGPASRAMTSEPLPRLTPPPPTNPAALPNPTPIAKPAGFPTPAPTPNAEPLSTPALTGNSGRLTNPTPRPEPTPAATLPRRTPNWPSPAQSTGEPTGLWADPTGSAHRSPARTPTSPFHPFPTHTADSAPPTTTFPAVTNKTPSSAPATPIYQRMVSEWLVEPGTTGGSPARWSSVADAGWTAAEEASKPTPTARTGGGLPIRNPGQQLVPGGLTPQEGPNPPDPAQIRANLTRHLSGVRTGRAEARHRDGGRR